MNEDIQTARQTLRAWVVFCGQADRPWLRLLKPGFRHCFLVMHDGAHWLSVDPMLGQMDVRVHDHVAAGFDLPGWLARRGHHVIAAPVSGRPPARAAVLRFFTCVEAVKRMIGLHARNIHTPWQLYRYLAAHQQPPKGE